MKKGHLPELLSNTRASSSKPENGTIFLDEVESIDEKVQVSLLRLIETQKFYRLGGKRKIATNARLAVASNENLQQLVEQGTFRKDLFYRLNVFPIYLPPLRQHKEDIPLLTAKFVADYARLVKKTDYEY